jgi:2-dehydropantoate 2-reductase
MKICVFGAGAIGGYVAAKLAIAGHEVSLVARGAHLEAIKKNGLTLHQGGRKHHTRPKAAADAATLGPQEFVFLSVKSPALPEAVRQMAPLLGPATAVISAMNGIPWWFFAADSAGAGPHAGRKFSSIDPGGALAAAIPPSRIVGCVLHIACSVPEPGVIVHNNQNKFLFGEASGGASARLAALAEAFNAAGIDAESRADIRQDIWFKLLGNLTFAPVSVVAGITNDALARNPGTRQIMARMIEEANAVGAAYGLAPTADIAGRIDLGGSLVGFRTSMLQDMDKGRPVELDTIVRIVIEMGRAAAVATPVIETVFGLAACRAEAAGNYRPWQ